MFNYLFFDTNFYVDTPKTKCRAYRSTKPKIDKDKKKKLKKISYNSKRKNWGV